jgi:hypothetical protein
VCGEAPSCTELGLQFVQLVMLSLTAAARGPRSVGTLLEGRALINSHCSCTLRAVTHRANTCGHHCNLAAARAQSSRRCSRCLETSAYVWLLSLTGSHIGLTRCPPRVTIAALLLLLDSRC